MLTVRHATRSDLAALAELRNHYVAHSCATFDEQPLSLDDLENWYRAFKTEGPHQLFVAQADGVLLGFCSSQPYRTHPAFRHTVETSVYVSPNCTARGVGSALYARLFSALEGQALHRALVGIALPNDASIALHAKFGFEKVGVFNEYAMKNGAFISSQWMQRRL